MKINNILIVDDNKDLAQCLSILLQEEEYNVTVVFNGEDALTKAREQHFDLAIIDVKLPGINGIEVFSTLRKITPETQGIMMTGHRVDQLLGEATDSGAVSILRKPFTMEKLLEQLDSLESTGILLVADDDPDFPEKAEQFLSGNGREVILARSREEAISRIQNEPADLLMLDLKLPIINGLDICIDLSRSGYKIPVIIVTGYSAQEIGKIDDLKSMSVTGCLFKPFNPDELLGGIESIIKLKEKNITREASPC